MSEANTLTNAVIAFLYKQGAFCWRQNTGGTYDASRGIRRMASKRGVSDVLCCFKGRMIAIEIKIGTDRLSPEQEGFIANVRHAGGVAFVVKTIDDLERLWKSEVLC
jgi:hypothetical protein